MTIAEFYGLKENPFEPTGAAVGKYRFVTPANFEILEDWIKRTSIEKKLYVLLVNSPHGAGKSTVVEELRQRAAGGAYFSYKAPVILTRLTSLSVEDFFGDVMDEARRHTKPKYLGGPRRPGITKLQKTLTDTLKKIARQRTLIFIIDEFDILADSPQKEQQKFLQFLRGVIDDLAVEDLPIAFIMSHTKLSSRDFEAYLEETHAPFQSRIVDSVSLAYTLEEVTKIVASRLLHASKQTREQNDIAPFTEEALRTLFQLITSLRGTKNLDNFRVFERCCHFALIEGAKTKAQKIGDNIVREVFNAYGRKELPLREFRDLSPTTIQTIAEVSKAHLLERNIAILNGIVAAITHSQILGGEVAIESHTTSHVGEFSDGRLEISSLTLVTTYRDKSVSLRWHLASSPQDLISEDEVSTLLEEASRNPRMKEFYAHIDIFSYVSGVGVADVSHPSFDTVLRFKTTLAEDLIGLGSGVEADITTLTREFDRSIAPQLSELIRRKVRDITKDLVPPKRELVQTLHVMRNTGQTPTKESLRQAHKELFAKSRKISLPSVNEIIQLGFATERATELIPEEPKAHKKLLDVWLAKGDTERELIEQQFGNVSQAVLDSASALGLIVEDGGKIRARRLSDFETEMDGLISDLKETIESDLVRQTNPGERIELLLRALASSKEEHRKYDTFVILSTLQSLGQELLDLVVDIPREPATKPLTVEDSAETSVEESVVEGEAEGEGLAEETPIHREQEIPVEDAIIAALKGSPPMALGELERRLRERGYEQDIRHYVVRLVLSGKVRISLGG